MMNNLMMTGYSNIVVTKPITHGYCNLSKLYFISNT